MYFGDIVYFYNIIFKNSDGSHEIDPYFSKGRPCVYIGEYEDNMYFLPLTKIDDRRDKKFFDIIIKPDKQNKLNKISKINYTTIIKKPSSFYQVKGNVNKKVIYEILKKSLTLYNCENFEYSNIVSQIMADYVIKENINLVDKKSKNDNLKKSNLTIGDITLLKQIIFSNNDIINVDHAFNSGRPCVYIGKYEGNMYFFPLKGYKNNTKNSGLVLETDMENKLKKDSVISVNEILKINISLLKNMGNIGYKNVLYMIKNYINYYYKNYDNIKEKDKFEIVFNLLNDELLEKNTKKLKKFKKSKKK